MRFLLALLLCSCVRAPETNTIETAPWKYQLVVAVDAKKHDYTDINTFVKSLRNHNREVGHAWVYVKGELDGREMRVVGGHTGEFGLCAPRFLDQMHYLIKNNDPDPIRALFAMHFDGQFEEGSGGHIPTTAVAFELDSSQFERVLQLFDKGGYDFSTYNILNHHCVHFASTCLAVAGTPIVVNRWHQVPQKSHIFGREVQLWSRPELQMLDISTPEALEEALQEQVRLGRAVDVLKK